MALDLDAADRLLNELPEGVRFSRRPDGALMLRTQFAFPDGDRLPITVTETEDGYLRLSDRGHTVMHASYDHGVDALFVGENRTRLEGILRKAGVEQHHGALRVDTCAKDLADAVLRLGQAAMSVFELASAR